MNKAGQWGEIYACRYLREHGFDVITTNYRCRFGEADIISMDKKTLVITEVKARSAGAIAAPAEFVTEQKQTKLALTAADFLKKSKWQYPVRFDVAEVLFAQLDNYKDYKIHYMKDAFRVD